MRKFIVLTLFVVVIISIGNIQRGVGEINATNYSYGTRQTYLFPYAEMRK